MLSHYLIPFLEATALLANAISGLIEARKKRMDVVGMYIVASVTAFGGGTLRDVLLERRPFYWVAHQEYTIIVFVLTLAVALFLRHRPISSNQLLTLADAVGLGLYSITGCSLALAANTPPFAACLIGVMTAIAGGMIRDVLCGETPLILRDNQPYATCAFFGCWLYIGLHATHWVSDSAALLFASGMVFAMRVLAWRLGLTLRI